MIISRLDVEGVTTAFYDEKQRCRFGNPDFSSHFTTRTRKSAHAQRPVIRKGDASVLAAASEQFAIGRDYPSNHRSI